MGPSENYLYRQVPDPEVVAADTKATRWPTLRVCLLVVVVGVLSSTVTFLAMRIPSQKQEATPSREHCCGNSTTEALSRGCTFDPLTFQWLPANRARDMTDKFLESSGEEPWKYWMDKDGKIPIQGYKPISKGIWYWTTNSEHMNHCAYMILRYYKATERGANIDPLTLSYGHAEHCMMLLLEAAKSWPYWNTINTHGTSGFPVC
jgi:hypothetical protein